MTFAEKYSAAVDKCYVECLKDPRTEPYKSKYAAKKMFEDLHNETLAEESDLLKKQFETLDLIEENSKLKLIVINSDQQPNEPSVSKKHRFLVDQLLDYHIGAIYGETEELSVCESHLRTIFISVEKALNHPLICALGLNLLNQLILVRTSYEKYEDAIEVSKRAESLYNQASSMEPYELCELIDIDPTIGPTERRTEFEQIFTHTLFYLAQIYGKLNNKDQSANYCRQTLERQLQTYHRGDRKTFEPLEWATNAATLSQYYMTNNDYATARHCLMSADRMLENVEKSDRLVERAASFKRCWIKYAVNLISDSADRLLQAADRDVTPNEVAKSKSLPAFEFQLSLPPPPITCAYVLDFEQARQVFLFAMDKIRTAKSYFLLDGFVTDHVEICQDTSQLYAKLVFFESHTDRKCKMHKRRINLLSSLAEEISEEHYLVLVRQILFELGECYATLLDLKLEQKQNENSEKTTAKITRLIRTGISVFERFISTLNEKKTKTKPDIYGDEYVRPVLLAHFYMARMHSKAIENRLHHLQQSLEQYKIIVDYVDKHPESKESIEQEYTLCKEMIDLLPMKLEKLRQIQ